MKSEKTPTPKRPGRRRRAPRGSVLILVVSLLVLMALIGTAWISTTRVDRSSTVQHSHTTQIDLLTDGVARMIQAVLAEDLFDGPNLRRAGGRYSHTDGVTSDEFLASRVPVLREEATPEWIAGFPPVTYVAGTWVRSGGEFYVCRQTHMADGGRAPGSDAAYWALGHSFTANEIEPDAPPAAPTTAQNSPVWPAVSRVLPPDSQFEDLLGQVPPWTARAVASPGVLQSGGRNFPALRFYHPALNEYRTVVGGDADGDGTADSFLYKLPVGRLNGLDYYVAVRIVDNNAAINASTALAPLNADDVTVARFPSSINLISLLTGPNARDVNLQTRQLNRVRMTEGAGDDLGGAPFNFPPLDVPLDDNGVRRPDFAYAADSVEQLVHWQLGRRPGNPGFWTDGSNTPLRMKALPSTDVPALLYRGGTLFNPELMPQSTLEMILGPTLYNVAANHPAAQPAGDARMSNRGSYPLADGTWPWQWPLRWFDRNFDYRQLSSSAYGSPENPSDPLTVRNRRVLMALSNGVSAAVASRLNHKPVWDDSGYDVGDTVPIQIGSKTIYFTCINPQPRRAGRVPGVRARPGVEAAHPNQVDAWEPVFERASTKASINSATFGRLFLAFYEAMGEAVPGGLPPHEPSDTPPQQTLQSPFKDALLYLSGVVGLSYDDPYIGRHFTPGVLGALTPTPVFPPTFPAPPGAPSQLEHPLRMFASPLRAVPAAAATAWGPATPRLLQDETMRLRAALAAVNAMDMRDNDHNVTFRDVTLRVSMNRGAEEEFEWQDDDEITYARARVYGHEVQPYVTEIYANTQTAPGGPNDTINPNGYVAVELYNPHPFPIDIRGCKLATIDRKSGPGAPFPNLTVTDAAVPANAGLAPNLAAAVTNLAGAATDPWVIPANGYLVLENYHEGGAVGAPSEAPPATYRPPSTGMEPLGAIAARPAGAGALVRNHAYVPNLHTVLDKEMVLLRPLSTAPLGTTEAEASLDGDTVPVLRYVEPGPVGTAPSLAVDMAPLDSFDFTGLPNPDAIVNAGRGYATVPPTPTHAFAWSYVRPTDAAAKAWRWVYPGRYDATQTLIAGGPRPRHQGTREAGAVAMAGWDTVAGPPALAADPWDITSPLPYRPDPSISLVEPYALAAGYGFTGNLNASYFPYEHPIQLTRSPALSVGAFGPNPPVAAGAVYPFGGFARNGDILDVPFIGSYRIKLTPWRVWPPSIAGRKDTSIPDHVTEPGFYSTVLELNAMTMDSAMAEDTDPANRSQAGEDEWQRTEQIGRFSPALDDLGLALPATISGGAFPVYGEVTDFTPPDLTAPTGGLEDGERGNDPGDTGGRWVGYEMEIVAGPGKGQIRQVVGYGGGGDFTVLRGWDLPLAVGRSKYVLRKGPLWKFLNPPAPPGPTFGGTGAYRWAADVLEYLAVETPQDDHFPPAPPMSYGNAVNDPPPPQGVANRSANQPAAITYGRKVGGTGTRFNGTDNLSSLRDDFYVGGLVHFVTGPAAGQVRPIVNYTASNRSITVGGPLGPFAPAPIDGDVFRIIGDSEEDVPQSGLINLNTAPWPVLARLPFFSPPLRDEFGYDLYTGYDGSGGNGRPDNFDMAMAIAHYRDGDPSSGQGAQGPFKSVFDLYKVPAFIAEQVRMLQATGDPDDVNGDWTPQNVTAAAVDAVRHDYEENFLLANRISNLVTTRSDHFTCYVLVQGWRGAGTANPELVVQRRRAFIADRSGVTQTLKEVPLQYFYNE